MQPYTQDLFPETLLVQLDNEQHIFTTSLQVAEHFQKPHHNIMRSIKRILKNTPSERGLINFELSSYRNKQNKKQPMYRLSKDGFIFVTMGFTGKKASAWKWDFIDAFNDMERFVIAQLKKEANAFYQLRQPWQAVVVGTQAGKSRADIAKDAGYTSVGSVTSARARLKQLGVLPS